jgi:hypothetical protein
MECAFGILSNKWRIFQRPHNGSPDFAVDFVKACVLHSFVRERNGYSFEEALSSWRQIQTSLHAFFSFVSVFVNIARLVSQHGPSFHQRY